MAVLESQVFIGTKKNCLIESSELVQQENMLYQIDLSLFSVQHFNCLALHTTPVNEVDWTWIILGNILSKPAPISLQIGKSIVPCEPPAWLRVVIN